MIPDPSLRFVPDAFEDVIVLRRDVHGCFDDVTLTLINLICYMFTADSVRSGVPPAISPQFPMTLNANTSDREYTVFPYLMFWAISQDLWLETVEIYVDVAMERKMKGQLQNEGHQLIVRHVLGSPFVRYFEAYRPTVQKAAGTDPYGWPEPWNFGRVLRNAFAHGGISFVNETADPVRWRSVEFGPAGNGLDPLFPHLGYGDIVDLYLELDEAVLRL